MRLLPPAFVVVACMLGIAPRAEAQWTRHHGGECVTLVGGQLPLLSLSSGGATNIESWGLALNCPSDDSDVYPDSAVTEIRAYVYDASPTDGVMVRACVYNRGQEAYAACWTDQHTSDSFVGPAVLTLSGDDLSLWQEGYDFGFIEVRLPGRHGDFGFSSLQGWITVGAGGSPDAPPWSRHEPLCRTVYPQDQGYVDYWIGLTSTAPHAVTLLCPVPDTSERPDSAISEVRLYVGREFQTIFSVRACRTAREGLAATCGPASSSFSAQVITLDPGSIWQPTDFGYLELTVSAGADFHNDALEGIVLVY